MKQILHYEIAEELGRGKNGLTFAAFDSGLQRAVTIKFIEPERDPAWRERFREVMGRCADIGDIHLARFYSLEEAEGRLFVVREYIEGRSLADLVAAGPLDYTRFLDITFELVHSLKQLHDRALVHGNLTAHNVLIDAVGHVHLADLGLGEGPPPGIDDLRCYAPERLAGAPAGESSDLYALGVLLHLVIVGRYPFPADSAEELRHQICNESLTFGSPTGRPIPGVARLLISKLMAREPHDRFSSSDELLNSVQAMVVLGEEPIAEVVEQRGWTPRQYLAISVLVLLMIILWLVVTLPSK
jgi:serine/threonine-protein kinase